MAKINWPDALKALINKYKKTPHPLESKNLYQLFVMVILSARDSDRHINTIAPALFEKFPDMNSLAKTNVQKLTPYINKVTNWRNKLNWILECAKAIKTDENIPLTMESLTELKGIGRKSANVIMREAGVKAEGVMVDLHVVRVAERLGITKSKDPKKIEEDIMNEIPQKQWSQAGMAISFLGRDTCRPTNPKHSECIMNNVCQYYALLKMKPKRKSANVTAVKTKKKQ